MGFGLYRTDKRVCPCHPAVEDWLSSAGSVSPACTGDLLFQWFNYLFTFPVRDIAFTTKAPWIEGNRGAVV
ncbi:MAG: hypothetical protein E3K29_04925 [Candidatus Brocadia sp.]|nr:hypothetical protein [Candidatus Brocadia sp.]